jgi:seryl-tRNA synthetase
MMLDIKLFRENPSTIKEGLIKRGIHEAQIEEIIQLDIQRRKYLQEVENLQYKKNQQSKKVGDLAKEGSDISALKEEVKQITATIKTLEERVESYGSKMESMLLDLPNIPDLSVPYGTRIEDNLLIRTWGPVPAFSFTPKNHYDLGVSNRMIDFDRGVRLGGNKFPLLMGKGASLSRKLANLMIENAIQRGYQEINPPLLGKQEIFYGSGQLPKFAEDLYKIEGDDSYLIPTGEVPLVNLFRGEILAKEDIPKMLTAWTACFRKEAGAAGKETKGLIRVHQFEKVELVRLTRPEDSNQALEDIVMDAESVLQKLNIPYRVILLSTFDMTGFSSSKTYDLEIWFPSMNQYVEISSCSNCKDFQARRANIRYRDENGVVQFVHTLNGSGVAIGRCMAALLENYQQEDGTVLLPDVLR